MLYFVIYAHISLIMLVLACSGFLISDLHISSQVIGEKNEVETKWIKEGCKISPIGPWRMIQDKNPRTKATTKMQCRKTMEPLSQRSPWAAHGVHLCPWWLSHGRLGRTAVRPSCSRVFRFSLQLFDFLAILCDKSLSFLAIEESIPFYNYSHPHRIA